MIESFGRLEFNFPWRSYQASLLKNFKTHISDNHFHVIAPPGSGKTILGLEIIRKLGKKTLILTPTLTIRNQWEDRLQSFFTDKKDFESYSFDLKSPSDITFSTYQSLHAFYKTFEDKEAYYAFFKDHNIETLVLDEAHHLKNAWWNCLIALKNNVPFYLVALTATPPYDSSRSEVSKYFMLCGDIDDEIAVPDLVKETDLCPHQDFVYFSKPKDLEINFIVDYRRKISNFKEELLKDETFISFIKNHRYFKVPNFHLEALYSNTEFFSAILIFLNACGVGIEQSKLEVLGFSGNERIPFPKLELEWLEVLFQNLLVDDREALIEYEPYILQLEKQLRQLNVFEKKRVNFIGEELLYKSLANSPSKLNSIVAIVAEERRNLKEELRCVVLTDYIRKEYLDLNVLSKIDKIGVVPIFQYLRTLGSENNELAVLSGSLVIIHNSIIPNFNAIENQSDFSFKSLTIDNDFVIVSSKRKTKSGLVGIITELFEKGTIKVLIGTKSLLGEGWDAPSINSLILASFIGSFVSSNQMRGRAIRKDANHLNKTGNIWHLACVDPTVSGGGRDLDILKRRFEAFVGVTNTEISFVSNGFDRLNLPEAISNEEIDIINSKTFEAAKNRLSISQKWKNAIGKGTRLNKEIRIFHNGDKPFKKQKQIYYFDAVRFFVAELFFGMMIFNFEFILNHFSIVLEKGAAYFVYAFFAVFFVTFGYKLYRAARLYLRYGYLHKKIEKFGLVILNSLYDLGYMTSSRNSVIVESELVSKGDVVCSLKGASLFENTVFSSALMELLDPIKSPRYLIVKTNMFRKRLNIENFYPVPEVFGDKKANVLIFKKHWTSILGSNKLFYTRQIDGRKMLLKARLFHVYNAFKKVSKEAVVWK